MKRMKRIEEALIICMGKNHFNLKTWLDIKCMLYFLKSFLPRHFEVADKMSQQASLINQFTIKKRETTILI